MRKKKKTAFAVWFEEQVRSEPDLKRQVQETLRGMKLKQETAAFFAERRQRANKEAFRRIMNRKGGEPPREGDEIVGGKGK